MNYNQKCQSLHPYVFEYLYLVEGFSMTEVAGILRIGETTLKRYLRMYNLRKPKTPYSQCITARDSHGNRFEWIEIRGQKVLITPREDVELVNFRSVLEYKLALKLTHWGVDWRSEAFRLLINGDGEYFLPDFYLPEYDCFIECKTGNNLYADLEFMDRIRDCYPGIDLILCNDRAPSLVTQCMTFEDALSVLRSNQPTTSNYPVSRILESMNNHRPEYKIKQWSVRGTFTYKP